MSAWRRWPIFEAGGGEECYAAAPFERGKDAAGMPAARIRSQFRRDDQ